jgi:hypothetical protein
MMDGSVGIHVVKGSKNSVTMQVVFDGRFCLKSRREDEQGTSGAIPY